MIFCETCQKGCVNSSRMTHLNLKRDDMIDDENIHAIIYLYLYIYIYSDCFLPKVFVTIANGVIDFCLTSIEIVPYQSLLMIFVRTTKANPAQEAFC